MAGRLVRSVPDCTSDLAGFQRVLAETVRWCAFKVTQKSLETCLRTPYILPNPLVVSNRFDAMKRVASNRQHLLMSVKGALDSDAKPDHGILQGGRLLIFFPDGTLSDGAAEASSHGYFDGENGPPWDTWVGVFSDETMPRNTGNDYLISWVPPIFFDMVEAGLRDNPESCIQWLDQTDLSMAQRLKGLR